MDIFCLNFRKRSSSNPLGKLSIFRDRYDMIDCKILRPPVYHITRIILTISFTCSCNPLI